MVSGVVRGARFVGLLGVALGMVVPGAMPAARAADECLVSIQAEGVGPIADDQELCAVAGNKACVFNLALCLNGSEAGCAPGTFKKKKIKATGHCGPVGGSLFAVPNGTAEVCSANTGDFAGITVRTKKNGRRPGKCTIRVAAKTTDGRSDVDRVRLVCTPDPASCRGGATTTTTRAATTTTTGGATTTTTAGATTTTTAGVTTTTAPTTTTTGTSPTTTATTTPTTTVTTTVTISSTTTTTEATTQCCVEGSVAGAFDTCLVLTPAACSGQSGIDAGPGACEPNPCPPSTTTTTASTTTTEAPTTTTTEPGPVCCDPVRIETTSTAGTLEVSTIPAFPFPSNVLTVVEVGAGDGGCKHAGVVPAGGFSVPTFCIPALGFSSDVLPTGCETGGADGAAMVWDAAATAPDPDVTSVGDTSDPDGNNCATLGTGCTTAGAGGDTRGNANTTRGGAPHAGGAVHTQVDIPVHSITWVDGETGECPDPDGAYDPGTDTLITEFDFILSPTTGHTSATFTDLNGDACAKAGNGPNSKSGDGIPAEGPCCVVGQATTVAATATAFTGGAPLYDITFKSITPTTVSSCAAPTTDATCTLTTDACKQ